MPAPIARVLDPTTGPGLESGPGVPTVLVGGMPVAVAGDTHSCANPSGHPPTPFAPSSPTVLVGGRPALHAGPTGDVCGCGAQVVAGFPTVLIG